MSTDHPESLTFLDVSGSPYEVGVLLGRFGAEFVQRELSATPAWTRVMESRGDPRLASMEEIVKARHPRHFEELRGLADGLEMAFADVFAWNCRGDVWAMAPDGCTTVQMPGDRILVAHNEDGARHYLGRCAVARVAPAGGPSFTTFLYPGSLPGHAFAVNEHGLLQTVNNVRSTSGGIGVPRMVLTRAVLDCADLDGAVALVRSAERAGGFHLTLAQTGDARLVSLEFTGTACSVRRIDAPALHSNHLVHAAMAEEPQIVTVSSADRQKRGEDLLASGPRSPDPLSILRDCGGEGLPIRRDSEDDPDDENTLATALFAIDGDRLDWSVYEGNGEFARFHVREALSSAA